MITVKLQILISVLLFLVFVILVGLIRGRKIEMKYALIWMGVDIAVWILVLFPALMDILSDKLGIASPVNMVFLLGFLFSLMIIFALTVSLSRMSIRIKKLAQRIALQEKKDENNFGIHQITNAKKDNKADEKENLSHGNK